jgi:hypothetical protein
MELDFCSNDPTVFQLAVADELAPVLIMESAVDCQSTIGHDHVATIHFSGAAGLDLPADEA